MDWSYIYQRNMLVRTIAHLLSLALLAEASAFQPRRARRALVDFFRLAEASGLRLCEGYGYWEGDTSSTGFGYSPHEATRLAESLRMIASMLSCHVALFDRFSAAQRAWIENFSLAAVQTLTFATAPTGATGKVAPVGKARDPPLRSGGG